MTNLFRTAVFTGHRDVLSEHIAHLEHQVKLSAVSVDRFVFGGAAGADTLALRAACDTVVDGICKVQIIIVVPAKKDNQPMESRYQIDRALDFGAVLHEMGKPYNALSLKQRNVVMVDHIRDMPDTTGSFVLAYFRNIYRSGTWHCMNYAEKNGIEVRKIIY